LAFRHVVHRARQPAGEPIDHIRPPDGAHGEVTLPHKVAFNFEEGVTRIIEARDEQLVIDAASRAGVILPFSCRDGNCGACKSFCEAGQYKHQAYSYNAMNTREARQRYVLTCKMVALSDCAIRISSTSDACNVQPQTMAVTIEEVRKLSPSSIGLTVKMAPGASLPFLPGQYVNMGVPGGKETRSYSFSSLPKDGLVEFFIRNLPGGAMSGYLFDRARPGDTVSISGPYGAFYLRDIARPQLFLAGGTGLAPFLAMLEKISSAAPKHPIRLIYGVTNDADLVEVEKLEAFAAKIHGFSFTTTVADGASQHQKKGFVTQHIADEHLNGGDVDVYLCGPPPMVEAAEAAFAERGVKPARLFFEKFNPA
jgi:benzoate/toluate 1,2-dioxygenase reductase subunit